MREALLLPPLRRRRPTASLGPEVEGLTSVSQGNPIVDYENLSIAALTGAHALPRGLQRSLLDPVSEHPADAVGVRGDGDFEIERRPALADALPESLKKLPSFSPGCAVGFSAPSRRADRVGHEGRRPGARRSGAWPRASAENGAGVTPGQPAAPLDEGELPGRRASRSW